jgi:predicted porin
MARAEYMDAVLGGQYANGFTAQGNAITALTGTVQYDLWKNVLSRVELRWDHADHGNLFGSDASGTPNRENAFLIAAQMVYKF